MNESDHPTGRFCDEQRSSNVCFLVKPCYRVALGPTSEHGEDFAS